jgi:hypothetical protein
MTNLAENTAYDIYRFMTERDVLACFIGNFSHQTNTSLLNNMRSKLENFEDGTDPAVKKKLVNVMVECLDNINRHSQSASASNSIFMICRKTDHFDIITGNKVNSDEVSSFVEKVEKINFMERTELREWYNTIIAEGEVNNKGGAGIGLIDIALKSGNKLEYETRALADNTSFLILKAKVNRTNKKIV